MRVRLLAMGIAVVAMTGAVAVTERARATEDAVEAAVAPIASAASTTGATAPATETAPAPNRSPAPPTVSVGPVDVTIGSDSDIVPSAATCGALDHPETGVQGDVPLADQLTGRAAQGYSCGVSLVSNNTLGGRGGNANMAWVDDCAYLTGNGVAVVDVADPRRPVHLGTLSGPGSDNSIETIAAVEAPGRKLLAAGRYGLMADFSLTNKAPVDIYDVADCRRPKLLTTFSFPGAVHNLTFSADGKRLWTTLPLAAADVTDPANPVFLGSPEDDLREQGINHLEYAHEAWPSTDGTRLYIGGQIAGFDAFHILDVEGWPDRPARVVGTAAAPGHSIRTARINGREYVLRSDESIVGPISNGCLPDEASPFGGASEAMLTDITDETNPVDVGNLQLAINQPEHCLDALASGVNGSSHYHDVDDPEHTTFAMVSMWNSGLRIFDVRDPAHPREVAYFNPGQYPLGIANATDVVGLPGRGMDMAWGHVRYVAETGQIWLLTRAGGFWVLELQPQVRAALGLPAMAGVAPQGGWVKDPGRPQPTTGLRGAAMPVLYCTLTKAPGLL